MRRTFSTLLLFICGYLYASAQISSPTAVGESTTQYQTANQDQIFVFQSSKNNNNGSITASMSASESASFNWYKLDESNLQYINYHSEQYITSSTISNLDDGLYKVQIEDANGNAETYQAWVINNWYEVSASINECDCEYTKLVGVFSESPSTYIDISSGTKKDLNKIISAKWEDGNSRVSSMLSPTIYNPPAENTIYKLTISDNLGCSSSASVEYQSIVPEAKFTASPMKGEAPLPVSFSNESKNADKYEWSFYRSVEELEKEHAQYGEVSDSILSTVFSSNPQYTYEESGSYMVKLLVSKTTDEITCCDEVRLENYIVADTSYIEAPNFFTPNGDGNNDTFLIKYTSMKSVKISIFNRWGKLLFQTSNNNADTYDNYGTKFAWDGKIGNTLASPGVYYYVVEGKGRDSKKHAEQGFFHLFREK